jgi:hypothetical protein
MRFHFGERRPSSVEGPPASHSEPSTEWSAPPRTRPDDEDLSLSRRTLVLGGAALLSVAACRPHARAPIMTYAEYAPLEDTHSTPYIVDTALRDGHLFYYGADHVFDPAHPQMRDIEARWASFRPDIAFNEGGDPPARSTAEDAVHTAGEAGLLRFVARRDGVPIASIDPTRELEIARLRTDFGPEEIAVFFALRQVEEQSRKNREAPTRAEPIEAVAERQLRGLVERGLEGAPTSVDELRAVARRMLPALGEPLDVTLDYFNPATEPPPHATNRVARALNAFRDQAMVAKLSRYASFGLRVFAVVGSSHVFMQERALRSA